MCSSAVASHLWQLVSHSLLLPLCIAPVWHCRNGACAVHTHEVQALWIHGGLLTALAAAAGEPPQKKGESQWRLWDGINGKQCIKPGASDNCHMDTLRPPGCSAAASSCATAGALQLANCALSILHVCVAQPHAGRPSLLALLVTCVLQQCTK